MKIKFLMTGLIGLISATSFAQKGELSSAQTNFDKFEAFIKVQPKMAMPSLNDAKTAIDKAAGNQKTAVLPQTLALKGAIYSSLAIMDSVETTSAPLFNTAAEAIKKAKELDTKGEYKKLIDNANMYIAQYQQKKGVKEYQNGNFEQAYKLFDSYRQVVPEDTSAILNTGLSAINAKNYPAAITNYTKLLTKKYSGNERIYADLSAIYLMSKDTANALKTVTEGITKYPTSADLRKREIEMSLQMGKQKEVLDKVLSAINNDPKNKTLYYYAGLVYSQTGDQIGDEAAKTKDAAAKSAALSKKAQNYTKAVEMYKKALELDPNYFEANVNMGYVMINPAIDAYNAANKLPANKQKDYDAAMAKATTQFDAAKPYLLKAVELNPKSSEALNSLLVYYRSKKDDANAAKITKQISELK